MTTPGTADPAPRFWPLLLVAAAVRAATVFVGVLLAGAGPTAYPPDAAVTELRERIQSGSARAVEPWYRWDAGWTARLGLRGYAGDGAPDAPLGVAFMPAMPAVIAAADGLGLNPFWAGLVAANLAGALGAAVFARVAARLVNDHGTGWYTLALLLAFPTAFFYSAAYNESFGLLFTALALAAWQANRPVRAGLAAAGGSLARMTGVALGVAAVADCAVRRTRAGLPRAAWVAAGSFAGLALFWGFLWATVGDPFAGLKVQTAWGRRSLSPWNPAHAVVSIFDPNLQRPDNARHFAWEAIAVFGFAALGVRAWVRRGTFWGVLTLVPVAQMLASGTLLSGHRLILAALPGFVELADLLRARRRMFVPVLLAFALGQFVLLDRFVHWRFAG